ncbi:MAG TPA: NAD(P)H-dependent glycerol-3-phosphate dehydrogenase [Polyangiaceae bacterium]|nr:NAD(P)H-dependent glycerol-3-phosphate dehydrogenase [Polyangiaceae bacterium]
MAHIAVLGAGAWGTALARHLVRQQPNASGQANPVPPSPHTVRLWSWQAEHVEELLRDSENRRFFPGFDLPSAIEPTASLEHCVHGARAVLVVVPTQAVRSVLEKARASLSPDSLLILASKGIENGTSMLLSEVVVDVLGAAFQKRTVALSGPSFAQEVARGLPTNLVAAALEARAAEAAQSLIASERLRVYTSDDPVSVEVGGALKNVIAVAAGASDGLGFGHNTRAALITRGLAEMARLAVAKGGNPLSLAGLSGLGDLVLTTTASLSRNRTVGFELGRGRELEDVLRTLGHVAEGVTTARSAYDLAVRLKVDLPITTQVYRVLYEHKPVAEAVEELLQRPAGREWS